MTDVSQYFNIIIFLYMLIFSISAIGGMFGIASVIRKDYMYVNKPEGVN